MSDPAIIRQILQILVGAPTSQLLFINGIEEVDPITREYNIQPSIDFAIRENADVLYSCISTHQAIETVFKFPEDEGIEVTVDDIIYPSVIAMGFNSHISSLICISPNEIYYIDYYEEMKRDTKDNRTWRLNYFLYRMTIEELKYSITKMTESNWQEYTRRFLGCNPHLEDSQDNDIQFNDLVMYTKLREYSSIDQFYNLMEDRLSLIRELIIDNTVLLGWSIHLAIVQNIPTTIPIQDELEKNINGQDYIDPTLRRLDYNYRMMLGDIELINYRLG